ncbi:MAG: L-threonylcarbamoyladenylate synthase [Prolixibacteraceae bacterium]
MLIKIYDINTDQKRIDQIVDVLRNGGIIVYPTDTVYGMGCDIMNQKAVEKVAKLKNVQIEKSQFSFICYDLSHLSDFAKPIPNQIFKLMRRNLPGPFTFILEANNNVPRYFKGKKKTIGIRIPDNTIIREIVKQLGNPILSTSIHSEDAIEAYMTDPELIYEEYRDKVDLVVDGGYGDNKVSTMVDCTSDVIEIIREGKGELIY